MESADELYQEGRDSRQREMEHREMKAAAKTGATWETHGCSAPGCGYPDGKPCIQCGLVIHPKQP